MNQINLFNTRTRKIESFSPIVDGQVSFYTCGPTVYNFVHIGNLRTYIFEDVLRRTLEFNGLKVNHVMNITDVGHLTDDADQGEDKMEKGSKREGKSAWDIALYYTETFKRDIAKLNILEAHHLPKATDHINEQIAQVQTLIDKGFTYETADGIYFDTTKVADYGNLALLEKQTLQAGSRIEMGEKKNPHDFALWKFSKENEVRQMEWDAFGKKGFPGWHIECSAMSIKYLGEHFDIHAGGIDHISVHHTNEIAQAEAATGKKPWVNFWLHGEFLLINNGKMAKSGGNFITLETLIQELKENGFSDPLAFRYFLLQAHYKKQLNFTWEALFAAAKGLENLKSNIQTLVQSPKEGKDASPIDYGSKFIKLINDDLATPSALALLYDLINDKILSSKKILELVNEFDQVLALNLLVTEKIPDNIIKIMEERSEARNKEDWAKSDELRKIIQDFGYVVEDSGGKQKIVKR